MDFSSNTSCFISIADAGSSDRHSQDGDMIAAEMYTEFHFFKDYSNFSGRDMKAGDIYITTNWCIYTVEDEKFKHIRVAHFRLHDPKTARL